MTSRFGSPLTLSRVHWVRPEVVVEVHLPDLAEDNLLRRSLYRDSGGQAGKAVWCAGTSVLIGNRKLVVFQPFMQPSWMKTAPYYVPPRSDACRLRDLVDFWTCACSSELDHERPL